mmetsp:Transcript_17487/g.27920  ORF Transcript_17487/g.27920 Transcript_17487/m.27920 type:complete len:163 (+) Transcript_17487:141-629(+)
MFSRAFIVALLVGVAFGASSISVSVKNCTKSTDEGKINSLVVSPPSPEKVNTNFTVGGNGVVDVAITDGTYKLVAKVGPITVLNEQGDICKSQKFVLPENAGYLYYNAVPCPISKGANVQVAMTAFITSAAPDDTVTISVTATDSGTKNEILCIDTTAVVKG